MLVAFPKKSSDTTTASSSESGQHLVISRLTSLSSASIPTGAVFIGESNKSPNVANPSARSIKIERAKIFISGTDDVTVTLLQRQGFRNAVHLVPIDGRDSQLQFVIRHGAQLVIPQIVRSHQAV